MTVEKTSSVEEFFDLFPVKEASSHVVESSGDIHHVAIQTIENKLSAGFASLLELSFRHHFVSPGFLNSCPPGFDACPMLYGINISPHGLYKCTIPYNIFQASFHSPRNHSGISPILIDFRGDQGRFCK